MAPVVSRESRPPKKSYVKRKQRPTPPKSSIRLTSVPREKVGKFSPKVEEDGKSPSKKANAVSTVAPDDACDTSEDSDEITSTSPLSGEVKAAKKALDAAGFHATCFVGILKGPKGAARTMRKTPKKTVKRGVLDYHDALLSHCLGL